MKLSVSLSDADVEALDELVRARGLASRSAGLQLAVRALRSEELADDYAAAFEGWAADPSTAAWDGTAGDGLRDAPR